MRTSSPKSPVERKCGEIQLIFGPMFSGKTTEGHRRVRRYMYAGCHYLGVKYQGDTRYSQDCTATHDEAKMSAISVKKLSEVPQELVDKADVIFVDEGQFFVDIVSKVEAWANAGKTVIVAALDGTFERKPFGHILELIPLADSVDKLSAVCMICGDNAAFSFRLVDSTQVELIGGAGVYEARCRSCHANPLARRRGIKRPAPASGSDEKAEKKAKKCRAPWNYRVFKPATVEMETSMTIGQAADKMPIYRSVSEADRKGLALGLVRAAARLGKRLHAISSWPKDLQCLHLHWALDPTSDGSAELFQARCESCELHVVASHVELHKCVDCGELPFRVGELGHLSDCKCLVSKLEDPAQIRDYDWRMYLSESIRKELL